MSQRTNTLPLSGNSAKEKRPPKSGRPLARTDFSEGDLKRFWSGVRKGLPDDCWEWIKCRRSCGYGTMRVSGYNVAVHRISFAIHFLSVPAEMCVCHSCDNPLCCNPNHLWLGDNAQNTADKVTKGRQAKGDILRSSGGKFQRAKTACLRGHPFSKENTLINNGKRVCRACSRARCLNRKNMITHERN
jgi:HNH endonuclease